MNELQTHFNIEKISNSRLKSVDFENLRFGKEFSDHMFVANYSDEEWHPAKIMPYQNLSFSPAACVFHYGQAIFEGLKAHKSKDGRILLFRPEKNFARFNQSAERMCMAKIPESYFIDGIKELVRLDKDWVPEGEGQSLYIRPFLVADDEFLGVKPSSRYKFMVITSPTSNYYTGAVSVKIENTYSRAAQGGIGAAKAAANYAASLYPAQLAKKEGYDQLIWTDAKDHRFIEESGTMNLMMIRNGTLITPALSGTILPGITRDSILHLARHWGMEVEERNIEVNELIEGLKSGSIDEAFGVGTAATIAPIKTIGFNESNYHLSDFNTWEFANKAKTYLESVKRGDIADEFAWTVEV